MQILITGFDKHSQKGCLLAIAGLLFFLMSCSEKSMAPPDEEPEIIAYRGMTDQKFCIGFDVEGDLITRWEIYWKTGTGYSGVGTEGAPIAITHNNRFILEDSNTRITGERQGDMMQGAWEVHDIIYGDMSGTWETPKCGNFSVGKDSLTIAVGSAGFVPLFCGEPPYTFSVNPDPTLFQYIFSENALKQSVHLLFHGEREGQARVIVTDSSNPQQTHSIKVTVRQ